MKVKDANKMSLQEACDYAVLKIVEQGGQCLDDIGDCLYQNKEGQHCAVGWLLNEKNTELMEVMASVKTLVSDFHHNSLPKLLREHTEVFSFLQDFHDAQLKVSRSRTLNKHLKRFIDVSAPQYQQWVDMGEVSCWG